MTAEHLRILYVAAECRPYIQTGGLGDVASALPQTLYALGHDVRVLIPGYGAALTRARERGGVSAIGHATAGDGRLLATRMADGCPLWLHDMPAFEQRGAAPYSHPDGRPYADDAAAFAAFARIAARAAGDDLGLDWQADIVHANDWHTGLVPVWLLLGRIPAASIMTIHNLAFQGEFAASAAARIGLPGWLYHWQALEHHERLSFMKGGITFADRITTVSAHYADEILEPARGEGLDPALYHRRDRLSGIVNGIDTAAWDPANDPHIAAPYSADDPTAKTLNRHALIRELGVDAGTDTPIIASIGRLTEQKGIDLIVTALDELIDLPACVAVVGSGEAGLEQTLRAAATRHPGRVHVHIGFDEGLAHRLYAGADMLLMPSRFEPCGLAQLNAMRYGTIPIVHATGGLRETVVDADEHTLAAGGATGFHLHEPTAAALVARCRQALDSYRDRAAWQRLVTAAMRRDSSWQRSAIAHVELYRAARHDRLTALRPAPTADPASAD